jgi:hypothetical protein
MKITTILRLILAILLGVALGHRLLGGDTYDCINATGDHINYGPAVITHDHTVIADDGARYEERWHAMLDDEDWKALIFLGAARTHVDHVIIHEGGN